jgi:hypothetical protein
VPENQPPVADAGPDQTVNSIDFKFARVTLNGTGSYDPDGAELTYEWTWPDGTAIGISPVVMFPVGVTTVALTVSDGVFSSTDTVIITVKNIIPVGGKVTREQPVDIVMPWLLCAGLPVFIIGSGILYKRRYG